MLHKYRDTLPKVFCKIDIFKGFYKIHNKTPVSEFRFNEIARRRLIKKRLQQICFPVSFKNIYFEELLRKAAYYLCYENKQPARK